MLLRIKVTINSTHRQNLRWCHPLSFPSNLLHLLLHKPNQFHYINNDSDGHVIFLDSPVAPCARLPQGKNWIIPPAPCVHFDHGNLFFHLFSKFCKIRKDRIFSMESLLTRFSTQKIKSIGQFDSWLILMPSIGALKDSIFTNRKIEWMKILNVIHFSNFSN